MEHQNGNLKFSIQKGTEFQEKEAINAIEEFMQFYWKSNNFPEVIYIKSTLPSILTYASDSTYSSAMASTEKMKNLVDYLETYQCNAINMDF